MRLHVLLLVAALAAASPIPAPQASAPTLSATTTSTSSTLAAINRTTSSARPSYPSMGASSSDSFRIWSWTNYDSRGSAYVVTTTQNVHAPPSASASSRPTSRSSSGGTVPVDVIFGTVGGAVGFLLIVLGMYITHSIRQARKVTLQSARTLSPMGALLMATSTTSTSASMATWPPRRDTVRDEADPELPTYSREVEPGERQIRVPRQEGDIADAGTAPPAYVSPTSTTGSGLPAYSSTTGGGVSASDGGDRER